MTFYMERHAEELRSMFVSHKGKEPIKVYTNTTWSDVLGEFRSEIQSRVKTEWLADWIAPGFSTSTADDEITATALMMGLTKAYFSFYDCITCGIPSITILGEKADWERIEGKIERLMDFGEQPTDYARRLRPILRRIVATFDDSTSRETRDFWNEIVQAKARHSGACDEPDLMYVISGWILGFFYWSEEGYPRFGHYEGLPEHNLRPFEQYPALMKQVLKSEVSYWTEDVKPKSGPRDQGYCEYDGVKYRCVALDTLPDGYAKVPIRLVGASGGSEGIEGLVVAGLLGKRITSGAPEGFEEAKQVRAAVSEPVAQPDTATSDQSSNSASAVLKDTNSESDEEDVESRLFTRIFRRLNCFSGKVGSGKPHGSKQNVCWRKRLKSKKRKPFFSIPVTARSSRCLGGSYLDRA
jgi:hypothetical protein